jgi:hypothetical protein
MNENQINKMVNRFLGWKLPKDFGPDGGIKFERVVNGSEREFDSPWWPIGTNLFTADQAKEMILHMLSEKDSDIGVR